MTPPSCWLLFNVSAPTPSTRAKAAVRKVPPTKARSRRIEGSAIRRLAVKNMASGQAAAATPSGARKLGPNSPCSVMKRPVDWPIDWPIQPMANSRIAAAIETKMSLKQLMSRNCSSSGIAVERCISIYSRRAVAFAALITPEATASSSSCWLYIPVLPLEAAVYSWCIIVSIHQGTPDWGIPRFADELGVRTRSQET